MMMRRHRKTLVGILSISSAAADASSFFEFDEFYSKHFSQEIIESFYGPVTKRVCNLIR
jgi:hypothetical protein